MLAVSECKICSIWKKGSPLYSRVIGFIMRKKQRKKRAKSERGREKKTRSNFCKECFHIILSFFLFSKETKSRNGRHAMLILQDYAADNLTSFPLLSSSPPFSRTDEVWKLPSQGRLLIRSSFWSNRSFSNCYYWWFLLRTHACRQTDE